MGKGVKVGLARKQRGIETAQKEVHPQRRTRLQAFWQLSQGKRIQDVVDTTGAPTAAWNSGQVVSTRWTWRSSETGGGHQAKLPKKPYLNPLQQRALVAKVQLGQFRTVWDAKEWVWGRWGVRYTYKGMYSLMKGLGLGLKVPRPHSDKADAKQQMAWKKGAYWMPWARLE